ncbi:hotdog fold thioesterase [Photobacterium sp. TLY01]|uniref:hotdog fold thioesterase n=1 Tax=Photobacterium sp. TLY01 TaxID=2907534 RepID=UPI001F328E2F|nr:hotdog fold thioesterase [Photobacterium sp. TLY01]UIP29811.1 hotdog fold thioesterase [Photobacterium sp. TLY01]
MSIWRKKFDLNDLNQTSVNTLVQHLGIEYSAFDDNSLTAIMPVDSRTHQPFGMLHGGASVVLAETLGSIAANMCVSADKYCVGLDINANHIRVVRTGFVKGTASPVHIGATTQVWQISVTDERDNLVCTSRLTMAVLKHKKKDEA